MFQLVVEVLEDIYGDDGPDRKEAAGEARGTGDVGSSNGGESSSRGNSSASVADARPGNGVISARGRGVVEEGLVKHLAVERAVVSIFESLSGRADGGIARGDVGER